VPGGLSNGRVRPRLRRLRPRSALRMPADRPGAVLEESGPSVTIASPNRGSGGPAVRG
jgi:hypothetical protein